MEQTNYTSEMREDFERSRFVGKVNDTISITGFVVWWKEDHFVCPEGTLMTDEGNLVCFYPTDDYVDEARKGVSYRYRNRQVALGDRISIQGTIEDTRERGVGSYADWGSPHYQVTEIRYSELFLT